MIYEGDVLCSDLNTDGVFLGQDALWMGLSQLPGLPVTINFGDSAIGQVISAAEGAGGLVRVRIDLPQVELTGNSSLYLAPLFSIGAYKFTREGYRKIVGAHFLGVSLVPSQPFPQIGPAEASVDGQEE